MDYDNTKSITFSNNDNFNDTFQIINYTNNYCTLHCPENL